MSMQIDPKPAKDKLLAMRHSAEHVLTQAMLKLYPGLKMAMGPATEEGFYFDFDPAPSSGQVYKVSEEDFPKIETEMEKIIKKNLPFKKKVLSISQARKLFQENQYKQEWLDEIEAKKQKATVYWTGEEFVDLCAGPHVRSTGEIKAIKLLSVAGAYWRGDEKNPMLTRIYGTAFPTKMELDKYLWQQAEAKKRDHRKIGKNLDLFVFSDLVGKGLPMFTHKGAAIRRELERFIVDEEIKRGYQHVYTPDIAKVELYETSGHYPYYKESMYPVMQVDEERLILRPMTCPHHFQLFASRPRSYKELPIRFAELASQFRYEKSGELTGLIRVRLFCLADSHIICRKDQAEEEINAVLDLIDYIAKVLGLVLGKDYSYRLSKGNRKDEKKFFKDDPSWDFAEAVLRKVLKKRQAPFLEAEGEAAFYGPKIDIQMKNIAGKEETAFTVQYDFVMPKRFKLRYIDSNGNQVEPVVIHRSSIGAIERLIAFLIEQYAGAFPVWLSPVQAIIVPIADRHHQYASQVGEKLRKANVRVEIDDRSLSMQKRIREAELQKTPYMLVVGDKEKRQKNVSVRARGEKDLGGMTVNKFLDKIATQISKKELTP